MNIKISKKVLLSYKYILKINELKMMDFSPGDKVKLQFPIQYLKTVDRPHILRPPDLVSIEEIGYIILIKENTFAEVTFRRGTFLLPLDKLEKIKLID